MRQRHVCVCLCRDMSAYAQQQHMNASMLSEWLFLCVRVISASAACVCVFMSGYAQQQHVNACMLSEWLFVCVRALSVCGWALDLCV